MKTIALTSVLFFGAAGLFVVSLIFDQILRDREFETKLSASIQFVEAFKTTSRRLPSDAEFQRRPSAKRDWMVDLVAGNSADAAWKLHGGKTSLDYCVRIWRGESWTYYFSWDKSYDIVDP